MMTLEKNITVILFFVLLYGFSSNAQSNANLILGNWISLENNRQINIYLGESKYYTGKIINEDSDKSQNDHVLLKNLSYNQDEQCYIGNLLPPEDGTQLDVKIYLINSDSLKLVAKKFIFSKTLYFQRLK